jgi:hypothetical protein
MGDVVNNFSVLYFFLLQSTHAYRQRERRAASDIEKPDTHLGKYNMNEHQQRLLLVCLAVK